MADKSTFHCCLIGDGTLLIRCAEQLLTRGHGIDRIVADHEAIVTWAADHAVEVIAPEADLASALNGISFDYLFSIANLNIIPADVLSLPRQAAINFHDGPLPRYAGLQATSWALLHGEHTHGVTWHGMGEKVDTGGIYKQRLFEVAPDETAFTLNAKCYTAGIESFGELLDELAAGTVAPVAQNTADKSYFGKYKRPAAAQIIDWMQPAAAIGALVRALDFGRYANPLGLPKLLVDGHLALVVQLDVLETPSTAEAGTITALADDLIQVATTTEDVVIRALRTPEGQPLTLREFAAEANLQVGSHLTGLDEETAEALTAFHETIVRQETFWQARLASLDVVAAPYASRESAPGVIALDVPDALAKLVGGGEVHEADVLAAAFALYLARVNGTLRYDLGWRTSSDQPALAGSLYAPYVPLRVAVQPTSSVLSALTTVLDDLARVKQRKTYARDLLARAPELKTLCEAGGGRYPVVVDYASSSADYLLPPGSDLALLLTAEGASLVHQGVNADALAEAFLAFVENLAHNLSESLMEVSLLSGKDHI